METPITSINYATTPRVVRGVVEKSRKNFIGDMEAMQLRKNWGMSYFRLPSREEKD